MLDHEITIGDLSERTGVAHSALRFYEDEGLIQAYRTSGNQRRYHREVVRRVSFIRVAKELGMSLEDIHEALNTLPDGRTPTQADWDKISKAWRPRLDAQIERLEALRDKLESCIGCGCLSLRACRIMNPGDAAADAGAGPRYLLVPGDAAITPSGE